MARQYVKVRFNEWSKKTYTYHWDGEPLVVGDQVKVPDPQWDGWKRVEVVSLADQPQTFATKAILGKAEQETEN